MKTFLPERYFKNFSTRAHSINYYVITAGIQVSC